MKEVRVLLEDELKELKEVNSVLEMIVKNEPLLNKWGMFIEIKHSQEDAEV